MREERASMPKVTSREMIQSEQKRNIKWVEGEMNSVT